MIAVSHHATAVLSMKDPTEGFGKVVGRVWAPRCVCHCEIATSFGSVTFSPILDGKETKIHVTSSFGWGHVVIDDSKSGLVIDTDWGCSCLWMPEIT